MNFIVCAAWKKCNLTAKNLDENEIAIVRDLIELTPQVCSEMFACKDKKDFAKAIICPAIEKLQHEVQKDTR